MVGLFQFNNGDRVQSSVIGFEGVVNGRADYLYGCNRYFIAPAVDEGGNPRDGYWFDEGDIILVEAKFLRGDSPAKFAIQKEHK